MLRAGLHWALGMGVRASGHPSSNVILVKMVGTHQRTTDCL